VAVEVDRLPEEDPEPNRRDSPGEAPRHAPAGSRSGTDGGGPSQGRERKAGNREAGEEEGGGGCREAASPARACRRRQVLHWQQPTQLAGAALQPTLIWSGPRLPLALSRATFSPREGVCAVPYSQFRLEPIKASSMHCWRRGAVESI